jgi:hypothetical protein
MRTRLEGTQASGEDELHIQEANVAEVSYGKPVSGEPECPVSSWNHPAVLVSESGSWPV